MTTFTTITVHELDELTVPATGDEIPIWDISEADYLRITYANLTAALATTVADAGLVGTGGLLAVGEGDGIDVAADSISVDVTEIIDTAYGLVANGNDIRINLEASGGLDFATGALGVDVTDFIDTAYGLTEDANNIRINLAATSGLAFSSGALLVGEGDGIDVLTGTIAVDVTEIIDTTYGLVANGNDIRVNLDADGALEFNAGATRVKLPTNHGLSRTAAGLALGTPSTVTAATTNAVATTSHTHAVTATDDGAANHSTILRSSAVGGLTLDSLTLPTLALIQTTVDVSQDLWTVAPANPDSENFGLRVENAIFNSVRDTTYQLGFNRGTGRDLTKASIYLQWEDMYKYSGGLNLSRSEFWLGTIAPSGIGGTYSRPWQVNLEHQSDLMYMGWVGDSYTWNFRNAYVSTDDYYVALSATTMSFGGGIELRFDENNDNVLKLPSAGGGWYDVLKMNAADEVVFGAINAPLDAVVIPGKLRVANSTTLLTTYNTERDVIIVKDETYGTRVQRIQVKNSGDDGASNYFNFAISDGAGGENDVLTLRGDKRVGINDTTPDATLDIVTADAAAVPVLLLEQLDVSEEILEIVSTAGVGNAVEAVGAKTLTTTAFLKVTVNGAVRYIPCGTIA